MPSQDHAAHLRANLSLHRAMTSSHEVSRWCRSCQRHRPDATGLCPLCQPESGA